MSLHQSPSTTGVRQEWGVRTHAQPQARAAWDLKNLPISLYINYQLDALIIIYS